MNQATARHHHIRPAVLSAVLVLTAALSGCALNPVTGERELALISEDQEIQMGRQADEQVVSSLGLVDDAAWQDYVQRLGEQLARDSERPNLPWTFRVVDDPVINAFALPGGFIYLTRGIVDHFTSEAQMVAVLGHEIGHVTARHSVNQMSQQQLAQLGLGLGSVLAPDLAPWAQAAQTGLGLLFLSYGRDDERQADDLGLRYMTREGYEPRAMAETFQMLATASGDAGSIPAFLSTHPDPLSRRNRVLDLIEQENLPGDRVDREGYLRRLSGMTFGADPREGYFEESLFLHPELQFRIRFPSGWQLVNQRNAVQGVSPDQDALMVLSLADAASPQAARNEFLGSENVNGSALSGSQINGLSAASAQFTAATQDGTSLVGRALWVEHRGNVFQVLGYAPESRWSARSDAISSALGSFDRVTDPEVLNARPDHIEIVRLPSAMTLGEFSRRYPSTIPDETLAVINQVDPGATIPAGTLLKRVVEGR